jgi:TPR repeat protein
MAKKSRYNKKKKVGKHTMKRSKHGGGGGDEDEDKGALVVSRRPNSKMPHPSSMMLRNLHSMSRELRLNALFNAPHVGLQQNTFPRLSSRHPSGMHWVLSKRLLEVPKGQLSMQRNMEERLKQRMSSVAMKKLAEQLCVNAEGLHVNSFTPDIHGDVETQVEECARTNAMAVDQLEKAIGMGSLKARACLAAMLLHGNTLGIAKDYDTNFPRAFNLVAHIEDPDCEGVLAMCFHFHDLAFNYLSGKSMLDERLRLAKKSADAGSKYGHFALGSFSFETDPKKAVTHFTVAADQNDDMALVALSELCMKGFCDMLGSPNYKKANDYLHRAAKQGNVRAFKLLSDPKVSPQDSGYWSSVSSEAKKHH